MVQVNVAMKRYPYLCVEIYPITDLDADYDTSSARKRAPSPQGEGFEMR